MAINTPGIAIVIRAFLPTGKTLDEQFEALSLVKDAHASGDYSKLLAAASIDDVKTEQKVRRMEEPAAAPEQDNEPLMTQEPAGTIGGAEIVGDDDGEAVSGYTFEDGIDPERENPDDFADTGDLIPWSEEAEETISLLDGPLDQPVADEPAPRQRRMAR